MGGAWEGVWDAGPRTSLAGAGAFGCTTRSHLRQTLPPALVSLQLDGVQAPTLSRKIQLGTGTATVIPSLLLSIFFGVGEESKSHGQTDGVSSGFLSLPARRAPLSLLQRDMD